MTEATKRPWKFNRQHMYEEHARLMGKPMAEHEGYFRTNEGEWSITDADGTPVCRVTFQGKAKRGEKWNAPDPEGMANAKLIVRAVNAHEALVEALALVSRSFEDVALGRGGWAWEDILDDVNAALALAKGE